MKTMLPLIVAAFLLAAVACRSDDPAPIKADAVEDLAPQHEGRPTLKTAAKTRILSLEEEKKLLGVAAQGVCELKKSNAVPGEWSPEWIEGFGGRTEALGFSPEEVKDVFDALRARKSSREFFQKEVVARCGGPLPKLEEALWDPGMTRAVLIRRSSWGDGVEIQGLPQEARPYAKVSVEMGCAALKGIKESLKGRAEILREHGFDKEADYIAAGNRWRNHTEVSAWVVSSLQRCAQNRQVRVP